MHKQIFFSCSIIYAYVSYVSTLLKYFGKERPPGKTEKNVTLVLVINFTSRYVIKEVELYLRYLFIAGSYISDVFFCGR